MTGDLSHLPKRAVVPPKEPLSDRPGSLILGGLGSGLYSRTGGFMTAFLGRLWSREEGQDVAEYAVMLAVVLVIVVGTVRLVGANASNVFSSVASGIQ